MSAVAGVLPRPLSDERGYLDIEEIERAIRPPDVHNGVTRLICVENTHNRSGGIPIPPDRLREIVELARERGVRTHVDGARIFNAQTALGIPAAEILDGVDTVSFCLSKGLSCPVGSLVCGSQAAIDEGRRVRKLIGGGMRQAGWIAAPGLVGLTEGVARLHEDHARAERLATGLASIDEIRLKPGAPRTNMVYFTVPDDDDTAFSERLAAAGVLAFPMGAGEVRYVVHRLLDDDDIDAAVQITAEVAREAANSEERDRARSHL
jgi:threonine aldolase